MADLDVSARFWDDWNARARTPGAVIDTSLHQRREILRWLREQHVQNANILEVGCGTGWLCDSLVEFGTVTGTDLSRKCLEAASKRTPQAKFVAGDFMALDFPASSYDFVVSLETLAHMIDQPAFVRKIASLLKPTGQLMLATQNKPMLERWAKVTPKAPGQERHWLDRGELRELLSPYFDIQEMYTITPRAHRMPLRLLTARRVRALIPGFTQWQEKRGWGWTIMVRARRRAEA